VLVLDRRKHLDDAVFERFGTDDADLPVMPRLPEQVLASAKADLKPNLADGRAKEITNGGWRLGRERQCEARQQLDMAVDRVAELQGKAELDPGEAESALERLQEELRRLAQRERSLRDRQVSAETRLQDGGAAGLYDELVAAREDLARAERERQRLERRARAGRLLWLLGRRIHDELASGLAGPLAGELAACLERVSGRGGRQVVLGEDLALEGLAMKAPAGDEEGARAVLADLSGGTQEQLGLLYRLALGRLLAGADRLAVVLDDPLGETDPARQARLLDLLVQESERLQILILTCHPERYACLGRARTFALPPL
jgi:hypothetical protein